MRVTSSNIMGGSKRIDTADIRDEFKDNRVWCGIGVVSNDDDNNHFEIVKPDGGGDNFDVYVYVVMAVTEESHYCRLAGGGIGGATGGVIKVPNVGDEVAVIYPGGEVVGSPMIVGTLRSAGVPDDLDETTLVIRNPDKIRIYSANGPITLKSSTVNLGDDDPNSTLKGAARVDDTTKNGTLVFFPGTGGATLTYLAPSADVPDAPVGATNITLTGKIDSGSTIVKVK
jgi:hypothetical protein